LVESNGVYWHNYHNTLWFNRYGAICLHHISMSNGRFCHIHIGFLFGIPKNISKNMSGIYTSNTNLEEISDWLTKIIVGLGLTQLAFIPSKIKQIVNYLSIWMIGIPQSIIISILGYFLIFGFFAGYLVTRIYLSKEFAKVEDDLRKLDQATKEADIGLKETNVVLDEQQQNLNNIMARFDGTSDAQKEKLLTQIIVQTRELEEAGRDISADQYFRAARIMLTNQNYLLAREYYIKSYHKDKNFKAGSNAGVICSKYLARYEEAEKLFKQIINDEPQNPLAYYNLACNYVRMGVGSFDKSVANLKKALEFGGEEFKKDALSDDTFSPLSNLKSFNELLPDYKNEETSGDGEN